MAASPASKAALRSGEWKEHADPKSSKVYYVQRGTKKTVWNLDQELGGGPSRSSSAASAGPLDGPSLVKSALKSGTWLEKADKSGKPYYYHAATKRTVWNLEKELLKEQEERFPSQKPGGTPSDEPPQTVEAVLKAGEWVEKRDPKGKAYYYHRGTRKTTWDLEKELGIGKYAPKKALQATHEPAESTEASPSRPESPTPPPKQACYDPAMLLREGVWSETRAYSGELYYVNRDTGATTADLGLYLQIQEALDQADTVDGVLPAGGSSGAQRAMATAEVDEWVSLIIRAPGHEAVASRLMAPYVEKRISEVLATKEAAERREDQAKAATARLEADVARLEQVVADGRHEIHQLQCALYYGLGTNLTSRHGAESRAADGRGASSSTVMSKVTGPFAYTPAVMDPIAGPSDRTASSLQQRVASLERALFAVQKHNRELHEENERLRRHGHQAATCRDCVERDPWRRVIDAAAPTPLPAARNRERVDAAAAVPRLATITAASHHQQRLGTPTFVSNPASLRDMMYVAATKPRSEAVGPREEDRRGGSVPAVPVVVPAGASLGASPVVVQPSSARSHPPGELAHGRQAYFTPPPALHQSL